MEVGEKKENDPVAKLVNATLCKSVMRRFEPGLGLPIEMASQHESYLKISKIANCN